jgi:hypothetical protein
MAAGTWQAKLFDRDGQEMFVIPQSVPKTSPDFFGQTRIRERRHVSPRPSPHSVSRQVSYSSQAR